MKFPKGHSGNPKGRKRGTVNKFTSLKQDFLSAYNDPRVGGVEGLITWLLESKHNRAMFYNWLTKLLPANVGIDEDANEIIVHIKKTITDKIAGEVRESLDDDGDRD